MSKYDLEQRTEQFATDVRRFVRLIDLDIPNREDAKQVVRSSGSIAANYIEANEALSQKDFIHRMKVSRKETKETRLWLNLIRVDDEILKVEKDRLTIESTELLKILSAIISKSDLKLSWRLKFVIYYLKFNHLTRKITQKLLKAYEIF